MSQALHWALPLTAACCPLGHAVQFAAATALSVDCPAGHAAQYDTPLGEKRPLPHVAHVYEMAMHPWPAGQSHGRHCMAPVEEYWPGLQARHSRTSFRAECFPGSQLLHNNGLLFLHVQLAMPVVSAWRPGLHLIHVGNPLRPFVDLPWLHWTQS